MEEATRILFISAFFPSPAADSAGVSDAYHILREISGHHEVTLLSFVSREERRILPELQKLCRDVIAVDTPALPGTPAYLAYTALSFASKLPAIAHMSHSQEMIRALRSTLARDSFDLAHVEFTQMAHYIDFLDGLPAILDESDIAFVRRGRYARTSKWPPLRAALLHDTRKLKAYEIGCCSRYQAILVRTQPDKELLQGFLPSARIQVFPPWVDFSFADTVLKEPSEEAMLFYGAMWRPANEQGALYFLREIYPRIRRHNSAARFVILGSRPSKRLLQQATETVAVTGYIPNVAPYYNRTAVVVIPLLSGSGIKGKIIQALACGKPVVTTSVGAEGIPATEEEGLFVRDDPQGFADCVQWLFEEKRYLRFRDQARAFVARFHDWQAGLQGLENLYRQVSAGPRARTLHETSQVEV